MNTDAMDSVLRACWRLSVAGLLVCLGLHIAGYFAPQPAPQWVYWLLISAGVALVVVVLALRRKRGAGPNAPRRGRVFTALRLAVTWNWVLYVVLYVVTVPPSAGELKVGAHPHALYPLWSPTPEQYRAFGNRFDSAAGAFFDVLAALYASRAAERRVDEKVR